MLSAPFVEGGGPAEVVGVVHAVAEISNPDATNAATIVEGNTTTTEADIGTGSTGSLDQNAAAEEDDDIWDHVNVLPSDPENRYWLIRYIVEIASEFAKDQKVESFDQIIVDSEVKVGKFEN